MRAGAVAEMRPRIEVERIAGDDRRAGRDSARRSRASAAIARSSRSIAITRRAPAASSARVSPPGPGPISTTVDAVERAGGARDAAGQIEIEQEILAERFLGGEAVAADDLAQRRQVVDARSCASRDRRRLGRAASRAASRSAAIRLAGSALPVPAMSKAVPWSGEVRTNGRPSVTLTA